ncbi:MAG: peptidylprolyl isomerase [Acidimicrobiales bacterium]
MSGADGCALPPAYSLFGKVVNGLEVVQAIESAGSRSGAPSEPVTIDSVTISEAD